MKIAIRVLVIIATIIGIVFSFLMLFSGYKLSADPIGMTAIQMGSISFFVIILSLIFGLVSSSEKATKRTTLVNGVLLFVCGLGLSLFSTFGAVLFIIAGFLGFLKGVRMKRAIENQ